MLISDELQKSIPAALGGAAVTWLLRFGGVWLANWKKSYDERFAEERVERRQRHVRISDLYKEIDSLRKQFEEDRASYKIRLEQDGTLVSTLEQAVTDISNERDQFLKQVEKLTTERDSLIRRLKKLEKTQRKKRL